MRKRASTGIGSTFAVVRLARAEDAAARTVRKTTERDTASQYSVLTAFAHKRSLQAKLTGDELTTETEPTDVATDEDLIVRIARGDQDAIGLLYDRYASILFPLALRILRHRGEAEDALHDAFVTVSERADQFVASRGSGAAWLVTLVRNLCIDRTRRRDRRGQLVRDVLSHEPVQEVENPEALVGIAGERIKVIRALQTLPEAQRVTLEVAFYEGLSYSEIAEREGVPLGTIKSRAARAIAALRMALAADGLESSGS